MQRNLYKPSYEITPLTLAIISHKGKKNITTVLEKEAEYTIHQSPSKVIDDACKFFGASLKGRQEGTRNVCGITHKAPISIDPLSGMYFFPTYSPTNPNCSWLAHTHINDLQQAAGKLTEIIFKNGKRIMIEASYGSLLNQVNRTAQFRYLLDDRIKFLQQFRKDPDSE
ncbi:competence protein ComK [Virgibacillus halotolerans]|uniref:competence protein ComK n=1 Tax=Virgibacillus halotolerans TaxID=1071053 RepID=UPI0019619D50|nr:competence protein ComK [Virgibacillus halotolerans]MBM7601665.1 competence protein ComK [Virgibacillus halotolerans]